MIGEKIWNAVEAASNKEELQKQFAQYSLFVSLMSFSKFGNELAEIVRNSETSILKQLYHDIRYAELEEDSVDLTLGGVREWFILDEFHFNARVADDVLINTRKKSMFI